MLEFLEESALVLEEIKTNDGTWRAKRGLAVLNVRFKRGDKAGEIVVDGVIPALDADERRGIQKGGLVEADVVIERPLVLKLPTNKTFRRPITEESGRFRVDKLANRQQFERVVKAITTLCEPVHAHKGKKTSKKPSDPILGAVMCRRPGEAANFARTCCKSQAWVRPKSMEGLNDSQQRALQAACSQSLVLVQGPPGTGKTALAVRIVAQWGQDKAGSNSGVTATSDSNIAVDNIVEGLASSGGDVVRMGRPEVARPEVLEHCVDELACKALGVSRLRDCLDGQRRHKVVHDIIKRASVLACTAIGAGSGMLEPYRFTRVLVDEASQATELATIVPACLGCQQLVLLGDHCQLPPTVSSEKASSEGLALSLFERLTRAGVEAFLLGVQYRMNPAISEFSRRHFYSNRLQDGINSDGRRPLQGFPWPRQNFPVALVNVHGHEVQDGTSFQNQQEAAEVVRIVKGMLKFNKASDIGIVSPYGSQVRLLRRLLEREGIPTFRDKGGVEVASVDGYQGREKEGIIMSTVRCSPHGRIGFVSDWRRANVAFTRARCGLVVVGNVDTLSREEATWLPWLHWVRDHCCSRDVAVLKCLPSLKERRHQDVGLSSLENQDFTLSFGDSTLAPVTSKVELDLRHHEGCRGEPSKKQRSGRRSRSCSESQGSSGSSVSEDDEDEDNENEEEEDDDESGGDNVANGNDAFGSGYFKGFGRCTSGNGFISCKGKGGSVDPPAWLTALPGKSGVDCGGLGGGSSGSSPRIIIPGNGQFGGYAKGGWSHRKGDNDFGKCGQGNGMCSLPQSGKGGGFCNGKAGKFNTFSGDRSVPLKHCGGFGAYVASGSSGCGGLQINDRVRSRSPRQGLVKTFPFIAPCSLRQGQ
eukprot:TRINITY_DN40451_c0_g1_i2.p1 TRINITY_DN40451_c0_g1~~TRINITY_DN40451_c0_g1_i2.p1  ORF type:complete len:1017 (+),score=190.28 TRINITY_DN40451_c0_g1_i2:435-3053(+)